MKTVFIDNVMPNMRKLQETMSNIIIKYCDLALNFKEMLNRETEIIVPIVISVTGRVSKDHRIRLITNI